MKSNPCNKSSLTTILGAVGILVFFGLGCDRMPEVSSSLLKTSLVEVDTTEKNEMEALSPNTSNVVFEAETTAMLIESGILPVDAAVEKANMDSTETLYVTTNSVNVRSAPMLARENILGQLGLNDEVQAVAAVEGSEFVQVQILKTTNRIQESEKMYVSSGYLSRVKNLNREIVSRDRYFMVQNIASEKLRIYERQCDTGNCAHKMVMETNLAVGEKSEGTHAVVGNFTISSWTKFYRDGAGLYPSWYDPNLPAMPRPGSDVFAWRDEDVMPGGGSARGAFGWYTAQVSPNSSSQWTHGTVGWGADKDKFIRATRDWFANLVVDPRSHGCSRTDNESIAYVRHLLSVGTPLIKIYAIEATSENIYFDPGHGDDGDKWKKVKFHNYDYNTPTMDWSYILTKNGVRRDGQTADRAQVLASGTPESEWLEQGIYTVQMTPTLRKFEGGGGFPFGKGAKDGSHSNVYALEDDEMRGYFLVDEGRLVGYTHPSQLVVGGSQQTLYPSYMIADPNTTAFDANTLKEMEF